MMDLGFLDQPPPKKSGGMDLSFTQSGKDTPSSAPGSSPSSPRGGERPYNEVHAKQPALANAKEPEMDEETRLAIASSDPNSEANQYQGRVAKRIGKAAGEVLAPDDELGAGGFNPLKGAGNLWESFTKLVQKGNEEFGRAVGKGVEAVTGDQTAGGQARRFTDWAGQAAGGLLPELGGARAPHPVERPGEVAEKPKIDSMPKTDHAPPRAANASEWLDDQQSMGGPGKAKDDLDPVANFSNLINMEKERQAKILNPANKNTSPDGLDPMDSTPVQVPKPNAKPGAPANANVPPSPTPPTKGPGPGATNKPTPQGAAPGKPQAPVPPKAPQSLGAAAQRGAAPLPLHERPFDTVSSALRGKPALEPAQRAAKTGLDRVVQGFRNLFAPHADKASGERGALTLRETIGKGERDTRQSEVEVEGFRRQVASLPEADRWALTKYMEGRSKGEVLPGHLQQLRDVADTLRNEMEKRRAKLENLKVTEDMNFIEDFVSHQWTDPKAAMQVFQGGGKTGSGGFTKGRSIPTYEEGIAKGLTPVTSDPIQNAINYVKNADRWIAIKEAVEVGREAGDVRYYMPGKQPRGWVEVPQLAAKKMGQRVYMPEGMATIYKDVLGRGIEATQGASLFRGLRQTQNLISRFKFALPGFHASVMATEGAVSAVGRAAGQFLHGNPVEGAKSLASALKAPLDPLLGRHGSSGKLKNAYEGRGGTALDKQIADIAARSNFRVTGLDKSMLTGKGPGSIVKALKRGTLKLEMQDSIRRAMAGGAKGKAAEVFHGLSRIMNEVSVPLFEHYIPGMKRAAFYDRMAQFLKENPMASEVEQLKFANTLSDSIDNRFGEMNQDNIMWAQGLKQASQLAMVSYSWELGTIREIGGGAFDILSGKFNTTKAEYVMGLVITSSILNMTYQYLMTGEGPKSIHDLYAPRTGGEIPEDKYNQKQPQRGRLPGYMKDVIAAIVDPAAWVSNKEGFLAQGLRMVLQGDYRGMDPKNPDSPVPGWLQRGWKEVQDAIVPITVQQLMDNKKGSNIGIGQKLLGIAPATAGAQSPDNYKSMQKAFDLQAAIRERTSNSRIAAGRESGLYQGKTAAQWKAEAQKFRNELNAHNANHKAHSYDPDAPSGFYPDRPNGTPTGIQ